MPGERGRDTGWWSERYGLGLEMYTNLGSRYTVRMRNFAAAGSSHQWRVFPSVFSTRTSGLSRVV